MALTQFQFVDNQTFFPVDINADTVFTSAEQINGVGNDLSTGIHVIIDYDDLQSSPPGAILCAVVEGKSDKGQFYIVARQFEEFNLVGFHQRRHIIMLQDLNVMDHGEDDFVRIEGKITDQISRQQGIMPSIWRVRITIRDPSSLFVSVRMSIYGSRFNQSIFPADAESVVTDNIGRSVTDAGELVTA